MATDLVDQVVRKERFLTAHPEWAITYVRSAGYFEAVREDQDGTTILTAHRLEQLMLKLERAVAEGDE